MKNLAVVTGTRAEFGLLQPLLEKIAADPDTNLQLVVTGMHLSPEFGMTVNEVRDAGYEIAEEIEMLLSSDTGVGTAKSVGLATIGFADALHRLRPDWLVVLGDRFEVLAAATAALLVGVPIAHIHGGERTEGAIDESIRHSVTKLAQLHFVSTSEYRKRVIQLGERPDTVFHVGAIGLDRIDHRSLASRTEIASSLGLDQSRRWCTVTYHPATTEPDAIQSRVGALIGAMRLEPEWQFVITKANADQGGRLVNRLLADFVSGVENAFLFDSLGSHRYLSCVHHSDVVLGNSSSAIIEAPQLGTPSVDVGDRQRGRVRGDSVTHCSETSEEIRAALRLAGVRKHSGKKFGNPYYVGGAAEVVFGALKTKKAIRAKPFYDLEFSI